MDRRSLGSSVHGISQAKILEQAAVSFSRGSSQPRDQTHISSLDSPPNHLQPFHVILVNLFNLPLLALLTRASNPLLPLLFILSSTYFIYLFLIFFIWIVFLLFSVSFSLIFTPTIVFFPQLMQNIGASESFKH